jgi:hypothetical protein
MYPYLIPMHALYEDSGMREKDSSKEEKPPPWKDMLRILLHVEPYAMHIPPLCG